MFVWIEARPGVYTWECDPLDEDHCINLQQVNTIITKRQKKEPDCPLAGHRIFFGSPAVKERWGGQTFLFTDAAEFDRVVGEISKLTGRQFPHGPTDIEIEPIEE